MAKPVRTLSFLKKRTATRKLGRQSVQALTQQYEIPKNDPVTQRTAHLKCFRNNRDERCLLVSQRGVNPHEEGFSPLRRTAVKSLGRKKEDS